MKNKIGNKVHNFKQINKEFCLKFLNLTCLHFLSIVVYHKNIYCKYNDNGSIKKSIFRLFMCSVFSINFFEKLFLFAFICFNNITVLFETPNNKYNMKRPHT